MIIHNAWRLDFNLSLASFEPNIRSTRNLIDLALASPHASNLRFFFASSVSSTQAWGQSRGAVPEDIHSDEGVAVGSGYGEGKYVAERVIRSVIYQRK
jgi:nucleoside-diphosphate-sugar epimerase